MGSRSHPSLTSGLLAVKGLKRGGAGHYDACQHESELLHWTSPAPIRLRPSTAAVNAYSLPVGRMLQHDHALRRARPPGRSGRMRGPAAAMVTADGPGDDEHGTRHEHDNNGATGRVTRVVVPERPCIPSAH